MPFAATRTGLETLILSEISQQERQIPHDITYVWNTAQRKLTKEKKITDLENRLALAKGLGGWDELGTWG